MTKPLTVAICLLAGPAWAQVEVQVRTEKPQFLAGESIFVLVEVKNVGTEQVPYDGASLKPPLELSVEHGERKVIKGLTGCEGVTEIGGGFGVTDHPPMLQPGKSTTFRSLLRGYRLKPGTYELRVSGTVDVGWREPVSLSQGGRRGLRSNDRSRSPSRERSTESSRWLRRSSSPTNDGSSAVPVAERRQIRGGRTRNHEE